MMIMQSCGRDRRTKAEALLLAFLALGSLLGIPRDLAADAAETEGDVS